MRGPPILLACALGALLLAGCSGDPPTAQSVPTGAPEPSQANGALAGAIREETPATLAKEYALTLTDFSVLGGRSASYDDNCLPLGDVVLVGGKATMAWSSPLPLEMELLLYDGQDIVASTAGTSPLELALPAGPVGASGDPYIAWQSSQETDANAAVQQAGTLAIDLRYSGAAIDPAPEACVIFH